MEEKSIKIRKDSEVLKEFIEQFDKHDKTFWLSKIAKGCMVPRYTVRNWYRGLSRIPELHKLKIEEIIGKEIFERITT